MKFSEHFQVLRRVAKYTFSINRKYTVLLIVNSFLSSIIGYVPIYFSAKVIDSLIAKASAKTVIFYVALTVGIVFVVNLLNTYISSEKDVAYNAMWRNEDWLYSEKAMQMAYEAIEDPNVTRLRLILSILVDTFSSRISLTMPPSPKPHNTACVLS